MQVNDLLTVNYIQDFNARATQALENACNCEQTQEVKTELVRPIPVFETQQTQKEICTI
jgi:hypothetical protein